MTQTEKNLKAIVKLLDEAAKLAKSDPYTADIAEQIEGIAEVAQEKLEEA